MALRPARRACAGSCQFGRYHKVEVEDNVTAYLEYSSGATGVFVTSRARRPAPIASKSPGTRGKAVIENNQLRFTRNEASMIEFSQTAKVGFAKPEVWNIEIPFENALAPHATVLQNFVDANPGRRAADRARSRGTPFGRIGQRDPLFILIDRTVELPLDGAAYEKKLQQLIAESRFQKKVVEVIGEDFTKSFQSLNCRTAKFPTIMYLSGIADEAGANIDDQIKGHEGTGLETPRGAHGRSHRISQGQPPRHLRSAFDIVAGKLRDAASRINCFGSTIGNWAKKIEDPFDSPSRRRAAPFRACSGSAPNSSA